MIPGDLSDPELIPDALQATVAPRIHVHQANITLALLGPLFRDIPHIHLAIDESDAAFVVKYAFISSVIREMSVLTLFLDAPRLPLAFLPPTGSSIDLTNLPTHEGVGFVVSRFCRFGDMCSVLDTGGRGLSNYERSLVMDRILEFLECLHDLGRVHGDMKPGNIVFDENPETHFLEPFIIDYGTVVEIGEPLVAITPETMGPGVAIGDAARPSHDIRAFAATVFFMYNGMFPEVDENGNVTNWSAEGDWELGLLIESLLAYPDEVPSTGNIRQVLDGSRPLVALFDD